MDSLGDVSENCMEVIFEVVVSFYVQSWAAKLSRQPRKCTEQLIPVKNELPDIISYLSAPTSKHRTTCYTSRFKKSFRGESSAFVFFEEFQVAKKV